MFTWILIPLEDFDYVYRIVQVKDYQTHEMFIQYSLKQMCSKGLVLGSVYLGHWIDSDLQICFAYVLF